MCKENCKGAQMGKCGSNGSCSKTVTLTRPNRVLPGHKNGCHNRAAYKESFVVKSGYKEVGDELVPQFERVPFKMTGHCNYTHTALGQKDPGCEGCVHRAETTPVSA